jgi:ATP-dependent RNA helicase DOB1
MLVCWRFLAGIVILMFDTQMEPAVARAMIKGAADPLMSAFSLRYSQLLQLARTEGSSPEMMLRVSIFLIIYLICLLIIL